MAGAAWTKLQDFYLRLGFLKALVAVTSPQRRSTSPEALLRRVVRPLFAPAHAHAALWERIAGRVPWYRLDHAAGRFEKPTVTEALLVDGACESLLFAITEPTAYKVLDWGHDVDLLGRGNQITERGLLLRHLLPGEVLESFFAGDVLAWNPFVLERRERLFLLFHLTEVDHVMLALVDALGELPADTVLDSGAAARLTCRALFSVLNDAKDALMPRDIPAYRVARELAQTIASELDLVDLAEDGGRHPARRIPKALKPSARRSTLLASTRAQHERRTTKNADHQTIPRFEQLVDLGFVEKPADGAATLEPWVTRRKWRYRPTDAARRWAATRRVSADAEKPFWSHGFAAAAVAAFGGEAAAFPVAGDPTCLASYLWRAYEMVHRPVGHTPLDSVALIAMVLAAHEGRAIEMAEFHRLMLAIKQRSALPEHAFFASGNELAKMFVQLRPGFVDQVSRLAPTLITLLEGA